MIIVHFASNLLITPIIRLLRTPPEAYYVAIKSSAYSPYRPFPLVAYLHSNAEMSIRTNTVLKAPPLQTINLTESYIDSVCNEFYSNGTATTPYTNICVPMALWQTQTYPTCNVFHELDLRSGLYEELEKDWRALPKMHFLGKGGSRAAVRVRRYTSGNVFEETALKVLRIDREFEQLIYDNQRVDALASERLSSAPDIMDIYGFCGMSALNELSSGLDIRKLLKKNWIWQPREIQEIILQASTSLARVHSIDFGGSSKNGTKNVTLVHNDITHNNYVISRSGRLKLSDFNLGILVRWNITSKKSCGFHRFGAAGAINVNSPPESGFRNTTLSEKVDIYGIGTLLFQFLTSHQLYEEELGMMSSYEKGVENEEAKVVRLITSPARPLLPKEIEKSDDATIIGLKRIMRRCLQYNAADRPTAQELVNLLDAMYQSREQQEEVRIGILKKLTLFRARRRRRLKYNKRATRRDVSVSRKLFH